MKLILRSISVLILLLALCTVSAFARETRAQPLPKLLDLGAHKCIPCKKMAPILVELEQDYKGVFAVEFIDVWKKENRARAKKYKVRMIPTQIFFDAAGKELWRHAGFLSKMDILRQWRKLGYEFKIPSSDRRK
jgi:thioredoxin 1